MLRVPTNSLPVCVCVSLQVEEAVSSYHRLEVATSLESSENKLALQGPRRAAIAQLAAVLKLRIQVRAAQLSAVLQPFSCLLCLPACTALATQAAALQADSPTWRNPTQHALPSTMPTASLVAVLKQAATGCPCINTHQAWVTSTWDKAANLCCIALPVLCVTSGAQQQHPSTGTLHRPYRHAGAEAICGGLDGV